MEVLELLTEAAIVRFRALPEFGTPRNLFDHPDGVRNFRRGPSEERSEASGHVPVQCPQPRMSNFPANAYESSIMEGDVTSYTHFFAPLQQLQMRPHMWDEEQLPFTSWHDIFAST